MSRKKKNADKLYAEQQQIMDELDEIIDWLKAAKQQGGKIPVCSPQQNRIQTGKIKVATRLLCRLDTAIRFGKGRQNG